MLRVERLVWMAMLGACLATVAPEATAAEAAATESTASDSSAQTPLPLLPGLKHQVEFWKKVFGVYSTHQVVIHDTWYMDHVYAVLDFRPLAESGVTDAELEAYVKEKVRSEKERVRAILVRLHQVGPDPAGLSEEERKIWAMFSNVKEPDKFLRAAEEDRIRGQGGLRERFAAGVEVSHRYLPEMENIFRRAGLPVELTRLPLVESCFNVRAYSKVGAAGIWQFMPSTGRLYMRIDDAVDERRDPISSTNAAADFLKANYDLLGNWPLAITAYNHGRAGVAHAVATVGSNDLAQIIAKYQGPAFRFASRNFYTEFLAALYVERHFEEYFGDLNPHPPLRAEIVTVPDYVGFKSLARVANTDADTLANLNPALAGDVINGKLHVPKGYRLRVPAGSATGFNVRYASIPADQRHTRQRSLYVTHRVKAGQTLAGIAKRYRVSVAAIKRHNNLRSVSRLRTGQSLVIPTG